MTSTQYFTDFEKRVAVLTEEARHSLQIWRGVLFGVGIAAVSAATLAGASSLGSIGGEKLAGGLALLAAVLTTVDKYLGAAGNVAVAGRRHQQLMVLRDEVGGLASEAAYRDEVIATAGDDDERAKLRADRDAWLDERREEIEKRRKAIFSEDTSYVT